LREAFNKLSSLGLIKSYQGRGTIVLESDMGSVMRPMLAAFQLDATTTCELMETRYALEASVARLAAKNSNAEQVSRLKQIIESMEEGLREVDVNAIAEADYAFHMQLAEMSKNRVLKQIIEVIREILVTFLKNVNQLPSTVERAVDYHRKICEAVERKEPDLAEKFMREHMMDVLNTLRAEYQIEVEI
jgi:GntR family transcriptional repressor for pyruvate dehydrogenase complex